jgi:hypothetical protein
VTAGRAEKMICSAGDGGGGGDGGGRDGGGGGGGGGGSSIAVVDGGDCGDLWWLMVVVMVAVMVVVVMVVVVRGGVGQWCWSVVVVVAGMTRRTACLEVALWWVHRSRVIRPRSTSFRSSGLARSAALGR